LLLKQLELLDVNRRDGGGVLKVFFLMIVTILIFLKGIIKLNY